MVCLSHKLVVLSLKDSESFHRESLELIGHQLFLLQLAMRERRYQRQAEAGITLLQLFVEERFDLVCKTEADAHRLWDEMQSRSAMKVDEGR